MMNTNPKQMATKPSKALLCFHGAGSSGTIFRFQLAKLRLLLQSEFEFIFVDAPHISPAGPGVLPLFRGAEPFYSWFGAARDLQFAQVVDVNNTVHKAISERKSTNAACPNIVGILAFSEGALAAALMLWQQQQGHLPWMPPTRFAIFICCVFPDMAGELIREEASKAGLEKALLCVPTLHIHGRWDWCLPGARKLVVDHYTQEHAEVMEFDGGHHCPARPADCAEASERILRLSKANTMAV